MQRAIRSFALLGFICVIIADAGALIEALWICAFGCGDTDIAAQIATLTFAPTSALGIIDDLALLVPFSAWLIESAILLRQHHLSGFLLLFISFPLCWGIALGIYLTHLPQTELQLNAWGYAVLWGGVLLLIGAGAPLYAALKLPPAKAVTTPHVGSA